MPVREVPQTPLSTPLPCRIFVIFSRNSNARKKDWTIFFGQKTSFPCTPFFPPQKKTQVFFSSSKHLPSHESCMKPLPHAHISQLCVRFSLPLPATVWKKTRRNTWRGSTVLLTQTRKTIAHTPRIPLKWNPDCCVQHVSKSAPPMVGQDNFRGAPMCNNSLLTHSLQSRSCFVQAGGTECFGVSESRDGSPLLQPHWPDLRPQREHTPPKTIDLWDVQV